MAGNLHNASLTEWSVSEVERLLDEGADINAEDYEGSTALHRVIRKERWDTAELLLERGAEIHRVDNKTRTPLHLAVKKHNFRLAEQLINMGADVNRVNFKKKTPLHMAAKRWNNDITKLLLDAKAEVNCVDEFSLTPLHFAAQTNNELVKTLLRAGADVDAVDKKKRTPLHLAVMSGSNDWSLVVSLLKEGASLDAVDERGRTPLHLVSNLDKAECLLSHGARTNSEDRFGITPFYNIIRNEDMTKLMIKLSAVNVHNRQCDIDLHNNSTILGERLPELKRFKEECIKEVDNMKKDIIENLSIFSVVSDSPDPKFALRTFEIQYRIDEVDTQNKYPNFMSILRLRFEMGVRKRSLMDEAFVSLPSLNPMFGIRDIGWTILSHLSIRDLKILITSYKL